MGKIRRRLHGRRGLKYTMDDLEEILDGSPPSRAAWIEILYLIVRLYQIRVAAFTGGVD